METKISINRVKGQWVIIPTFVLTISDTVKSFGFAWLEINVCFTKS